MYIDPDAPQPEPEEDTDLIELPDLDAETPDEEEETPEEDDKPLTLDEKFTEYFEKQTGVPTKEFAEILKGVNEVFKEVGGVEGLREGLLEIKNNRMARQIIAQQDELAEIWDVNIDEVKSRLKEIKPYFEKLPKKEKALYDSPKGADVLWRSIQANGAKTKSTKSSPNSSGKRYLFTQQQIDAMSADEYRQNAEKITYAYNNGLVGE